MSETYTTYGIGPDKQFDELKTLRDERDRLRANLVNCVARLEAYYGEDYPAVDSYQRGRVDGIQQGIDKLREREKFYTEQEAISQGQMRLTRGLQRNESSGCIRELEKLAQQAQGGAGDGKESNVHL